MVEVLIPLVGVIVSGVPFVVGEVRRWKVRRVRRDLLAGAVVAAGVGLLVYVASNAKR